MQMCVFFFFQELYRWASIVTLSRPSLCLLTVKSHRCAISTLYVRDEIVIERQKNLLYLPSILSRTFAEFVLTVLQTLLSLCSHTDTYTYVIFFS